MEHLKWNRVLDKYLETGHMLSEEYEELDDLQKYVIQELKKSFKRLNKSEVCETHHSLQEYGEVENIPQNQFSKQING